MLKKKRARKSDSTWFALALIIGLGGAAAQSQAGTPAIPARFGLSPDNSQALLLQTLRSAKSELLINIYEFESTAILKAMTDAIRSGTTLRLLIEGQPLGNMTAGERDTLKQLHAAMKASGNPDHRIYIMEGDSNADNGGQGLTASGNARRYVYNHAKYVIADGTDTLISSENFKDTGHPQAGWVGNRGWETVLTSKSFAKQMTRMFEDDADPSYGDVREIAPDDTLTIRIKPNQNQDPVTEPKQRPVPALPAGSGSVSKATLITSPDSLAPLRELFRSATRSLDIQHMSMPSTWRDDSNQAIMNPLVAEAIEAARRGAEVRLLMNDDRVFLPKPNPNAKLPNVITRKLIEQTAACENLPLHARIVDVLAVGLTYIHNKGTLVDGARALVSSINGSKNSVANNREVAVLLESPEAAQYYKTAFDFDWASSAQMNPAPVVNQAECPPARLLDWMGLAIAR
jgi:cardiolipin synthase